MVEREVAGAIRRLGLSGRHVLVAVSGGIDSTVLAHVLQGLSHQHSINLSIGHVNHGLRGAESDADQEAVAGLAEQLGLPFDSRRVDPRRLQEGESSRTRPTLQEAARRVRYTALEDLARSLGADCIVTAHTASDQAETVLLRLLRGSSPDGLGGIPEWSPNRHVARPLLAVSREAVERWAREKRLRWREDLSNASPAYARNRLRQHWLPGLAEAFNPQILRAICDLAEAQRRDADWIDTLVEQEATLRFRIEGGGIRIVGHDWQQLPEALGRRLARRALVATGGGRDLTRMHVARVLEFLRQGKPGTGIELPGGRILERRGDDSWLGRKPVKGPGAC